MNKLLMLGFVVSTLSMHALAGENDDGWYLAEYDIKWGGPHGSSATGGDYPGCFLLYTDLARWEKDGGEEYGDLWIEEPTDGFEVSIYRDGVLIATDRTSVTGWNEFIDYNVVPGVTYIYEIKYGSATTGPASVACDWIYKIEPGSREVAFGAEGGVANVSVSLFKQTTSGSTRLDYYDSYFLVKTKGGDWLYAERYDVEGKRHLCQIEVDENDTGSPREGVAFIEFEGFVCEIKIRQAAKSDDVLVETDSGATVSIPKTWFDEKCQTILQKHGNDYAAAANDNAASGRKVWECYVAGTDPTDADDVFKASITFGENGEPVIGWTPEFANPFEAEKRKYRKYGKARLQDKDWTEFADGEERNFNFFKVTVEMR